VTALSWIAYAVGVAADVASTRSAIKSGRGREGNPLLAWAGSGWAIVRLVVAVAVGAVTLWVDEPAASYVRLGLGLFYGGVAVWNWRVAGRLS
jgi:hypothetical protein